MANQVEASQNPTAPGWVKAAACVLWLLALLQFTVSILFVVHRSDVWSAVAAVNPSLSGQTVGRIVNGTIIGSMAIHGAIAALYVWLATLIRKAENRARIAATVLLVITTAGGWLFLEAVFNLIPGEMPYVMLEQGTSLGLRVVTLCLLWGPSSSSRHFVARQPPAIDPTAGEDNRSKPHR